MSDIHETCRDYRATIPLLVQKILDPDVFPIMCYEPLNVQNRMCELCTFSQIRSHIMPTTFVTRSAKNRAYVYVHTRVFDKIFSLDQIRSGQVTG